MVTIVLSTMPTGRALFGNLELHATKFLILSRGAGTWLAVPVPALISCNAIKIAFYPDLKSL